MFQAIPGLPYHLMQPVYASARATALAVSAEYDYAGANSTVVIYALGTKLTIIPAKAINVMASQRIEIIAIQKYTGSTKRATSNIILSHANTVGTCSI